MNNNGVFDWNDEIIFTAEDEPTQRITEIDVLKALEYIDPADLTYTEWLAVGMDLKFYNYDVRTWDSWSASDPRYKNNECFIKWNTFNPTYGGVIAEMAQRNGYTPDRTQPAPFRRTHRQRAPVDPVDMIETFEDNPEKWELAPEIETAHKRLMENNPADYVITYDGGSVTTITPLKYLTDVRKIPLEFIQSKKIGYAVNGHNQILERYPEYKNYESKNTALHKIILPYSNGHGGYNYFLSETVDRNAKIYAGLDADGQPVYRNPEKYKKPKKDNATTETGPDGKTQQKPATVPTVKAEIYNEYLLKESEPPAVIFVTEGIYDALSVEVCGGCAVAFVGTAQKRFLSICKKYRPQSLFVVALDNDASGNGAVKRVTDGLTVLNLRFITRQAPEPYKDFNECLQKAPELLTDYIKNIIGIDEKTEWFEKLKAATATPPRSNDAYDRLNNALKSKKRPKNGDFRAF